MTHQQGVRVAVAIAAEHGVRVDEPVVLCDAMNVVVRLTPSRVLARVVGSLGDQRGAEEYARREVAVASFLTEAGAPVAPPATELPPGPHERDGFLITFWTFLDHDPKRVTPSEAAQTLRLVHQALEGFPDPLPSYDFLGEIDRLLAEDDLASPNDLAVLRRARERIALPNVEPRPLHGDVNLGNVLATPMGHLWTDFENACAGPLEFDLAALEWEAQWDGSRAAREVLQAYGHYDQELLHAVLPIHALFLTAWTLEVARRRPEGMAVAQGRLEWWRQRDEEM